MSSQTSCNRPQIETLLLTPEIKQALQKECDEAKVEWCLLLPHTHASICQNWLLRCPHKVILFGWWATPARGGGEGRFTCRISDMVPSPPTQAIADMPFSGMSLAVLKACLEYCVSTTSISNPASFNIGWQVCFQTWVDLLMYGKHISHRILEMIGNIWCHGLYCKSDSTLTVHMFKNEWFLLQISGFDPIVRRI